MNKTIFGLLASFLFFLPVTVSQAKIVNFNTAEELENRFRIDHMVSHVTLFIQREYGSPPSIIILPDGRKWYSTRHPENVKWMDGITGDIVYIPEPMAGPWQLISRIAPGSKLEKISDIQIEVQPLPQPLYQGETIKVTANLKGDGKLLQIPGLELLMDWRATVTSAQKADQENFAAGFKRLGDYHDNGKLLDEAPGDGIFTSNFDLDLPWGDYVFSVKASNEVFSREYSFPIRLKPSPIEVKLVAPPENSVLPYRLNISANSNNIKLDETHIEYNLHGPNGYKNKLILDHIFNDEERLELPKVTKYGSYTLSGKAVTTTKDGREIMISLPTSSFSLLEPPEKGPSEAEVALVKLQEAKQKEESAKSRIIMTAVVVNLIIIIACVVGFIYWRKRKIMKVAMRAAEMNVLNEAMNDSLTDEAPITLDEIDLTLPEEKLN
ncbi:TIGR03503 family protein [Shewanella sp. 202IG2-18]|uniref:TIGR03503 family protein n=1 Tax=Parashewanella hymeniacidonis TaxID=2807618 RepID=UPI00196144A1|nr:TIGR03503 family protein [Parashewanella hymeniacidonis]MBM7073505.1 TIGR03503 family protein [Parashewanella hymeniacidonis]